MHRSRGRVLFGQRSLRSGRGRLTRVASERSQRRYAGRPVPQGGATRILDASGIACSTENCRPWRLLVLGDREHGRAEY
jgi:hypothetical protein